jgi:hypothetical protein
MEQDVVASDGREEVSLVVIARQVRRRSWREARPDSASGASSV